MGWRKRVLRWLAELAVRRARLVFVVAALVAVAAVVTLFTVGLRVETSRVSLWPDDHPLQERFEEYQELFGSPFQLVVVVESDDPEQNKAVAERLAAAIGEQVPEIGELFYRVDLRALKEHALFYLPEDRLKDMAEQAKVFLGDGEAAAPGSSGETETVTLGGLLALFQKINEELARIEDGDTTGLGRFADQARDMSRMGAPVLDELERWVVEPGRRDLAVVAEVGQELGTSEGLDTDGYLVADGGRMVLLMGQPRRNDDNLEYLLSFVEPVRRIVAAERAATPGVKIGITGMPAFVTEELDVAKHDLRAVTLISAVGVLLLFLLGYGSLLNTAFIFLTLGLGVVVDLAIAALAIGRVNLISSLFVAVLLGLGIDYGIQLINRFQEELRRGRSSENAVRTAVVAAGEGVLTGGVTTAVAFFTMALGEFKPLRELGIVAGAGILLILAASFVLLPALLVTRGRRAARLGKSARGGLLGGRWLLPVLPLRGRRAAAIVVAVGLAVTAALAIPIRPITFSNDLISMLPPSAPSVQWLRRLEQTGTFTTAFNASIAGSLEEVRARAVRFDALETTSRVLSIDTFLPRDAESKAPYVREIRRAARAIPELRLETPPIDVAATRAELSELAGYLELDLPLTLKTQGMADLAPEVQALAVRVRQIDAAIAALPSAEAAARLGRLQDRLAELLNDFLSFARSDRERVTPDDLPPEVAKLFYRKGEDGPRYLLRIYPSGDINDDAFMPRFLAESREVDAQVTGYPVNYYEFALVMQADFRSAFLYAVIAILLLLALDLRRLRDVGMALVPLAMSGVCMVGAMNLIGMDYNLANIMAIPLIVGIGVAYGVYVIHRARETSPPRPRAVVRTTGKAVLFSALTTMVSFGAMSTASHRGAAGLGLTLLLGIGFCLLTAVAFLPALIRLVPPGRRRDRDAPGGEEDGPGA